MKSYFALIMCLLITHAFQLSAQNSGTILGVVSDASTGQTLPGATVQIEEMTIGTTTNIDGAFRLMNLPLGQYTLVVKFIGFNSFTQAIVIEPGAVLKINAALENESFGIDEIVISAQMLGQAKAINQQMNSDAMVNVVSSDKIKELPDVNAAEAIGRLPGISLIRNGGEASRVVVRGLTPSLTSVTINGVRVPSSGANDRAVDLSMISPDLLSNIEVFKSPTADMDGDAIGGIINLGVTKAPNIPQATFRLYGGFNNLQSEFGNYKGTMDLSQRFFKNKFGVVAKANYEQIDRIAENIGVNYNIDDTTQFLVNQLNLSSNRSLIKRMGASVQLDYQYRTGSVVAQTFFSKRRTDSKNWSNSINNGAIVGHSPSHTKTDITTWQAMVNGKQNLSKIEIDWVLARSNTENDNYFDVRLQIDESSGVEQTKETKTIQELYLKRKYNYQSAWIHRYFWEPASSNQFNNTAGVDFKIDYHLGSKLGGFIKFGGKYKSESRERVLDYQMQYWYYLQPQARATAVELWPHDMVLGGTTGDMIMIDNFYSTNEPLPILNGEYGIHPYVDMDILDKWHEYQQSTLSYQHHQTHQNYSVTETVSAGYIMTKINFSHWFTMIPGLRYEYSDNIYNGIINSLDFNASFGAALDTTSYQRYGELLPSVHVKIKPLSWFDIRLSAVKTLARPNYNMIIPAAYIDLTNARLSRSNPNLKHAEAWNYDAMISLFSNKYGLLTFGGFYKAFNNYFINTQRVMSPEESVSLGYPKSEYDVIQDFINFDNSKVYGFEVDLQTKFDYLPWPFNGIVLSANATRLFSETYQPLFTKVLENVGTPTRPRFVVDYENSYYTYNKTSLPDQVKWISNVSLGYDYKGFSARISSVYQARYLKYLSSSGEGDLVKFSNRYEDNFLRFDASISQKIGKNIMIMANLANFTGEGERSYQYLPKYTRNENHYGRTFDLGIQFKF